ncbi:MAG: NAD(P)-dependent oxidoreductase [Legionellaceae bacterium]|nr:NAD(P)-dependent oxidoreductase [Legionellaceae bacterium]
MNVLIIGGSGFMGSHTADELSQRGHHVTIFDRAVSPWLKDNQKMVIGDYMDGDTLSKALNDISVVYHFAGVADIGQSRELPYETIESNVMGLTKVLENVIKAKCVKRFVYASTMYVYSNHGSFYRASKQAAEIIIEAYAEEFGLEFTLLRYGSLYGPRAQNWNGIRRFASQIVQEGVLDYNGDGSEMREYIYVQDAARLSVDVLDSSFTNRAITITGQQLMRVDDLISVLFEISGQSKNVRYQGEKSTTNHYGHTPYRYTPKAAKKLVPQEFVDLGQGLLDVIEEIHCKETSDVY